MLSDCHSAALVSCYGSVDWLCHPRFDSPSLFGRLLDDGAGYGSIRPKGECETSRRYLDQTLVLETTFTTDTGVVALVDALATGESDREHDLGKGAPGLLLRRLAGVSGDVEFIVEYVPRPEYGLVWPLISSIPGGFLGRGGANITVLSSEIDLVIGEGQASGEVRVTQDQRVGFALHYARAEDDPPRAWSQQEITKAIAHTLEGWSSWSKLHQSYDGPWHEEVHHSGRVLQGLT